MKTSDIYSYFTRKISSEKFFEILEYDKKEYSNLMNINGTTIPLYFYGDEDLFIDKPKIKQLLRDIINGQITNIQMSFLADCISLSEKVVFDLDIEEIILNFADQG